MIARGAGPSAVGSGVRHREPSNSASLPSRADGSLLPGGSFTVSAGQLPRSARGDNPACFGEQSVRQTDGVAVGAGHCHNSRPDQFGRSMSEHRADIGVRSEIFPEPAFLVDRSSTGAN